MQDRSYTDLFDTTQALCGVVFASIEKSRIKALINRRARKAYKSSNYWSRFIGVGEERAVLNGVIPFDESELASVDTFLRVFVNRPYGVNSNQEYQYIVGPYGATLLAGSFEPEVAYVTYKAQFAITYGPGTSDGDPSGSAADVTAVPSEWFDYMAHGAYADYLRAEGQQEKAAVADQEANEMLLDELMRLDEQHTQTVISPRIFTNANMQMRSGGQSAVGAASTTSSGSQISDEYGEVIITEG
jgi:hypothetical protein